MNSIDKLREYGARFNNSHDAWSGIGCEILEIADEIEREVKELADERDLLKTQWEAGVDFDQRLESCAENREDVTLFGVDYMAYPLDADGVPIHAMDMLDGYGKTIEVVEMRYGRSGWVLISRDGNGYADCAAFTHHHAPTVEDVLAEFAQEMNENLGMYTGEAIDADEWHEADERTIAEFAKRLRLAGDE